MNQDTPLKQIDLRYRQGTSDKVYRVAIEASGGGYVVNFAYGRRGATLNTGAKTQNPVDYAKALAIHERLVKSKTAKGYAPHESSGSTSGTGMQVVLDANRRWPGLCRRC